MDFTDSDIAADIDDLVGNPRAVRKQPINSAVLADLLDLTENRVVALARTGAIPRVSKGRYDQREAVRAYIRYLRQNPTGRKSNDPALADERRRLVREQADREAIRNATARGELVASADVEARWMAILADVRSGLLALPTRLNLPPADVQAVDRAIRDLLTELGNG
jgi:phage terminase Nu1 subunit (DNA packaging protein)